MRNWFIILILAFLTLFISINVRSQNYYSSSIQNDTVIIKNINEKFELSLFACPDGGYRWSLSTPDTTTVKLINKITVPFNNRPAKGGYVLEKWSFEGLKTGSWVLKFVYKRSWESEIIKFINVKVTIE